MVVCVLRLLPKVMLRGLTCSCDGVSSIASSVSIVDSRSNPTCDDIDNTAHWHELMPMPEAACFEHDIFSNVAGEARSISRNTVP